MDRSALHAALVKNVGQKLRVCDDSARELDLHLNVLEVDELAVHDGGLPSFSALFSGPSSPRLDASVWLLEVDDTTCEIFLSAVGQTADGFEYEAVFN